MLLEKKSINIVDNFFNPWQFKLVLEEIKKLKYYDVENHPAHNATEIYPGLQMFIHFLIVLLLNR